MSVYPESFERDVRECLSHMYDFAAMQEDSLVGRLVPHLSGQERIQAARKLLIDTIEQISQRENARPHSRQSRVYHVLLLRYVEEQPIPAILDQLALSERQFYRELNRAVQVISQMLWDYLQTLGGAADENGQPGVTMSVRTEIERAYHQVDSDTVELFRLLVSARQFTTGLAERYGVLMTLDVPDPTLAVRTSETVLKQAVICLLSETIKHLSGGSDVTIYAYPESHEAVIRLSVAAQPGSAPDLCDRMARHPTINSLVDTIGAELTFETGDLHHIVLHLPHYQRTLLVIDDNPDVIALIERYVAQSPYTVVGALEARQGINLAHRLSPFVIILDVMMPGSDGWEVLQYLKTQPGTSHIPVLICSVLDTPELAISLGADFFLKKPPGRVELLRILGQMAG